MDRDLTWGGEHTVKCVDGVVENHAPETCMILLTSVTQKNLVKRKKRIIFFLFYLKMCVFTY